jgi:hypothetical protein
LEPYRDHAIVLATVTSSLRSAVESSESSDFNPGAVSDMVCALRTASVRIHLRAYTVHTWLLPSLPRPTSVSSSCFLDSNTLRFLYLCNVPSVAVKLKLSHDVCNVGFIPTFFGRQSVHRQMWNSTRSEDIMLSVPNRPPSTGTISKRKTL